jgi:hypothetical protein
MSQEAASTSPTGLARLSALVGTWTGATRTRFTPDDAWEECPVSARFRWVAADRFLLHEYDGRFQGEPAAGAVFYGYDEDKKTYSALWVDSFHSGPAGMMSYGAETEDAVLSVSTTYGPPDAPWGWHTVIRLESPDELVIQSLNEPAGEKAYVAIESRLRRAGSD